MKRRKSFTLVEIMLVVIIIGVLASLVVPRLTGKAERARRIAAKADVQANIPSALDFFEMDMGKYPRSLDELVKDPGSEDNWNGPYLKKLPKDPWGNEYSYQSPGDHNPDYDISSPGRDGILGNKDDVVGWED